MLKLDARRMAAAAVVALAALLVMGCKLPWSGGPQGWDATARTAWYNGDQGSRLMPLSWFEALEQPDAPSPAAGAAPALFLDPGYMDAFRVIPQANTTKLPVGFAVDRQDDSGLGKTSLHWISGKTPANDQTDWVGLNCAACHTAEMSYGAKTFRVDGAPSLFDFQSFVTALDKALVQTRDSASPGGDGKRWGRFASAVLGKDDTPANRQTLLAALNKLIDWETQTEALNKTDPQNLYGYGRVDAVGHIYNRILLFGGAPQPTPNAANAPVSYPHLWNITRQTQLQWDGIATNDKLNIGVTPTDYGALGRNVGEVLGVFGDAVIKPRKSATDISGFASSANVVSLNAMEVLLTRLKPPAWPSEFGQPGDIALTDASGNKLTPQQVLAAGSTLFQTNCAGCHTPHTDPQTNKPVYERMETFTAMGANLTDEGMACNAWANTGFSGALTGIAADYVSGTPLTANEPVRVLLTTTVKGALIGKKGELVQAGAANIFGVTPLPTVVKPRVLFAAVPLTPWQQRIKYCMDNAATQPLLAYKARPLEGIWATGPFLHNGSVPTLYALLQAPDQRPKTFNLGTRVFDPKKVGYDTSPTAPGNSFVFDTAKDGNSNKGHVYGVDKFTETQRLELLEYLKTVPDPAWPQT